MAVHDLATTIAGRVEAIQLASQPTEISAR
jgi:hypothetical protein